MRVNDLLYVTTFSISCFSFFFFNDTATTEIYTLSLHDALPIARGPLGEEARQQDGRLHLRTSDRGTVGDAPQARAGDGERHEFPAAAAGDHRAHLAERPDDAAHGPPADRGVAGQHREEVLSGEH